MQKQSAAESGAGPACSMTKHKEEGSYSVKHNSPAHSGAIIPSGIVDHTQQLTIASTGKKLLGCLADQHTCILVHMVCVFDAQSFCGLVVAKLAPLILMPQLVWVIVSDRS